MTNDDKKSKYFEAVGRRKTSVARVRISSASKNSIIVNDKDYLQYFITPDLQAIAHDPFDKVKIDDKFAVSAKLNGGGIVSQAGALRHGIARALVKYNEEMRKKLKIHGFLKRDPRMKERRKFGLKKARKAPQWSKR